MKNSNRIFIFAIAAGIAIFSNFAYSKGFIGVCDKSCPEGKECRIAHPKDKAPYEYCGKPKNNIKDPSIQNSITADPNTTPRPQ